MSYTPVRAWPYHIAVAPRTYRMKKIATATTTNQPSQEQQATQTARQPDDGVNGCDENETRDVRAETKMYYHTCLPQAARQMVKRSPTDQENLPSTPPGKEVFVRGGSWTARPAVGWHPPAPSPPALPHLAVLATRQGHPPIEKQKGEERKEQVTEEKKQGLTKRQIEVYGCCRCCNAERRGPRGTVDGADAIVTQAQQTMKLSEEVQVVPLFFWKYHTPCRALHPHV